MRIWDLKAYYHVTSCIEKLSSNLNTTHNSTAVCGGGECHRIFIVRPKLLVKEMIKAHKLLIPTDDAHNEKVQVTKKSKRHE